MGHVQEPIELCISDSSNGVGHTLDADGIVSTQRSAADMDFGRFAAGVIK